MARWTSKEALLVKVLHTDGSCAPLGLVTAGYRKLDGFAALPMLSHGLNEKAVTIRWLIAYFSQKCAIFAVAKQPFRKWPFRNSKSLET
ncbi:MAG TPA: hypothetical protein IAA88_06095 [Candidatus Avimuribaculum pullicola]|nr:hypothetical protein [Candidatus Avimuribaculum pullicola]